MKLQYIATLFVTGAAAAAVAAAPSASAAGASASTNTKPGNVEIQVKPGPVSDAHSYGQFSSPVALLGTN
jgi:hypothetical protein